MPPRKDQAVHIYERTFDRMPEMFDELSYYCLCGHKFLNLPSFNIHISYCEKTDGFLDNQVARCELKREYLCLCCRKVFKRPDAIRRHYSACPKIKTDFENLAHSGLIPQCPVERNLFYSQKEFVEHLLAEDHRKLEKKFVLHLREMIPFTQDLQICSVNELETVLRAQVHDHMMNGQTGKDIGIMSICFFLPEQNS